MGGIKFDKNKIKKLLKHENDYITDLLTCFNVPDSIEEVNSKDYLLDSKGNGSIVKRNIKFDTVDELEDRLNTIKNKIKTKTRNVSEKSLKKREAKKLKKNKEFKKVLQTAHKRMTNNIHIKSESESNFNNSTNDIKKVIPKPIFNADGKIVFSKFDFAAHPGAKTKKSKKDKVMKNPKQILENIKETEKKLRELKEQGDEEKVKELKTEMAWKKAFDKVDGKKVKDDPKLLYKAIKRKKDEKKKSKQQWVERKKKVEHAIQSKQKKRTENINKKLKEKKNKKLKKLSKKGRIIPGF